MDRRPHTTHTSPTNKQGISYYSRLSSTERTSREWTEASPPQAAWAACTLHIVSITKVGTSSIIPLFHWERTTKK